jgi:hypothetical protein
MEIIRFLHAWVRWLVILIAVINFTYLFISWLRARPFNNTARRLMTWFSSLVGAEWLIGMLLLILLGGQTGFGIAHYWQHALAMTFAVIVAHLHYSFRRRKLPDATQYRNSVIILLAVFGLVLVGIMLLPADIRWRLYLPS